MMHPVYDKCTFSQKFLYQLVLLSHELIAPALGFKIRDRIYYSVSFVKHSQTLEAILKMLREYAQPKLVDITLLLHCRIVQIKSWLKSILLISKLYALGVLHLTDAVTVSNKQVKLPIFGQGISQVTIMGDTGLSWSTRLRKTRLLRYPEARSSIYKPGEPMHYCFVPAAVKPPGGHITVPNDRKET